MLEALLCSSSVCVPSHSLSFNPATKSLHLSQSTTTKFSRPICSLRTKPTFPFFLRWTLWLPSLIARSSRSMAAVGSKARTHQTGILRCVVRSFSTRQHSVARFHTAPVASEERVERLGDFGLIYPAWSRSSVSLETISGFRRGYASGDGKVTGAVKTSDSDASEESRVDARVRDELGEPEGGPQPGLKEKAKQVAHAVGEKVKETGKSITGSSKSKGVEKVGDAVKGAGDAVKDKASKPDTLGKEDVVTS